jgi:hypothetical protein
VNGLLDSEAICSQLDVGIGLLTLKHGLLAVTDEPWLFVLTSDSTSRVIA